MTDLFIGPDTAKIGVINGFDPAGFRLHLIVTGMRPFIVYPTTAIGRGNLNHILKQLVSIFVEIDQVLADQIGFFSVVDHLALRVHTKNVKVFSLERATGLIEGGKGRIAVFLGFGGSHLAHSFGLIGRSHVLGPYARSA